jgi:lysozyme family protein
MVLHHEGGYVWNPSDPGGETKYGISKRAYPEIDIVSLTKEDAEEIYKRDYWDRIKGDDLPVGIACVVMDYAVNSGISRASKALQSACGLADPDGIIGPHTLNIVWATIKNDSNEVLDSQIERLVNEVTKKRQEFIRGLSIYETFGKGWERRIDETRNKALELI